MSYITNWLQNNKVAVCLYLYHTDLWPEFKTLLTPLKDYIKLYIGLCTDNPIINDFNDFDCTVTIHKNYGADVAPFLHQLSILEEPIFIKLHSKKSLWGYKHHIEWRHLFLHDFISSQKILKKNIIQLNSRNNYALLSNKALLFNNREGTNQKNIEHLCDIIKIDYATIKNNKFVAGNMFMGKTEIFKKCFLPYLSAIDKLLYQETGKLSDQKNGTYSHAMERLFGYIIEYNNYKFCYPKHEVIKILNNEAPNKKYFRAVIMYNNYCYLVEDPNVYGYYKNINANTCSICWYHLDNHINQIYKYKDKKVIQKYATGISDCK